ncbi:DNA-binding transcriptional regulator, XRE-family HTH domain [Papillibacter cinnamivorans DSM 12816]|uniref:DNA-binding transcriptional regulator, XRE-family HTH domain n=1 Tax=Papillibacter cinnamivorans DSM 12816 TaxID=1122930 RepID=A0A1W2D281_9FIRM|nr:DNA-binding transcriptional regulator, XRE-family HTH domain [Papillibacter cinnamivorans DSM 12816]
MKRLAELRKGAGLTQASLGRLMNAAQNSVSNWENGTREPSNEDLKKLADYFGVSIDYLLERTDDPDPPSELIQGETEAERLGALLKDAELRELAEIVLKVSPASAKRILEVAQAFLAQEQASRGKNA